MDNTARTQRQFLGVEKYFNSRLYGSFKDRVGCLNYWTGVGKTYTATLVIKKYFKEYNPRTNFTILVPNEPLLHQWNKVLSNLFLKKELEFIKVYTADYVLTNELIINSEVLIVDELDAFYSEERFKLIDKTYIRYIDVLGLTATYEDYKGRHTKASNYVPIIDKIDEKEALAKGYISEYIEYNLALDLTQSEQERYNELSKTIRKNMSKFGRDGLDLAMKCLSGGKHRGKKYSSKAFCIAVATQNGWYQGIDTNSEPGKTIDYLWNPQSIFRYSLNLIKAIKERKEMLYNNTAKLQASVEILNKYRDLKLVVFSQSTVFADSLYSIVNQKMPNNSVLYHSKVKTQLFPSITTGKMIKHGKKRLKDRALYRISKGMSNHLITSSVMDKGLDIPELVMGVSTSGTQNPTQQQQRTGRVKRLDPFNKDKVAIIVNLYNRRTRDEEWLKNRQSKSTNIIYDINSIDEISYKPINNDLINEKDL